MVLFEGVDAVVAVGGVLGGGQSESGVTGRAVAVRGAFWAEPVLFYTGRAEGDTGGRGQLGTWGGGVAGRSSLVPEGRGLEGVQGPTGRLDPKGMQPVALSPGYVSLCQGSAKPFENQTLFLVFVQSMDT